MTLENKTKFYRNPKIERALQYALSFIITILFLYLSFAKTDFKEVVLYTLNAKVKYIVLFILIFLLSHFLRAVRWKYILSSVKSDISIKNLFNALMLGYGVNCVIPRAGEVTRAVLIGKWEGLSQPSMLGTVILERIIDIIFFAISIIISFYLSTESLYQIFPWLKQTMVILGVFIGLSVILVALAVNYRYKFYEYIIKIVSKISEKAALKITNVFEMLFQGFSSLRGTKNYLVTFLLSIAIVVLYALNSYIGFLILGMETIKSVNYGSGWIIMSLSSIAAAIPTPGSTGSYHLMINLVLTSRLFLFEQNAALGYATLTHFISYIMFILTSLIIFGFTYRKLSGISQQITSEIKK